MSDSPPLFPITYDVGGLTARDLLRQWFKYWRTVALSLLLVAAMSWLVLLCQPSVYEASAKIWVQTDQQETPSFLSGIATYRETQEPEPVDRKFETEMQLLQSRSNADAVVSQLGITKAQLIQPPLVYLLAKLPDWMRSHSVQTASQSHSDTVALFLKGLSVEPLRSKTAETSSNVLEAHFVCADRATASLALTALLQEYVQFGARHNREVGESADRLVNAKIHDETDELKKLDQQILSLTVSQASQAEVSAAGVAGTPRDGRVASASALGLLKSQAVEMQAKLEEAQQLFTDDSPNVRHIIEQLRVLRGRLTAGVRKNAELDGELERLDRQRSLALQRFIELRTKRDQIELYLQLNPVDANNRLITEPPVLPDKPKLKSKLIIALLGPIGGLLLGLLLAGMREYFDHRLQGTDDVKRYLGMETLGVVHEAGHGR